MVGAYSSIYNAIHALFIEYEKTIRSPKSNQSTIKAFHDEFVHTSILKKEYAVIVSKALNIRNDGVYGEEFDFTPENLDDLNAQISSFNAEVKRAIREHQQEAD